MNVTDLIERLRKWHNDTGAPSYRDAADALEAQAREIAELRGDRDAAERGHDAAHAACVKYQDQVDALESSLAAAERDAARLKERLEEATDLLGFAEIRLLAFGQHHSANPEYVLAMDAIKLFLLTADAAREGK